MKKIILLLLFGLLALSACGREMWLKGEVIGRETDENGNLTAIVTETETHGIVRSLQKILPWINSMERSP